MGGSNQNRKSSTFGPYVPLTPFRGIDEFGAYLRYEGSDGQSFCIDEGDEPILARGNRWRIMQSRSEHTRVVTGPQFELLHRKILDAPKGIQVDHEDANGLNCRRYNIRLATSAQNGAKRHHTKGTASGYRGVYYWPRGTIFAMISINDKMHYLGLFPDEISAAKAWDAKAKEARGKFAVLNFPENTL